MFIHTAPEQNLLISSELAIRKAIKKNFEEIKNY